MNDSVTAISVLEFTLKKYCQTIFKHLQPGLTEEQMNSLLTDTTFNFSELKKIYSWRNGTSADFLPELSRRSFHACGNFMPLKVAVSMKEKLDSLKMWDSGLFPFLSNGDRDYLLIDLKESSCTYGMLFILSQTKLVIPLEPAYDSFYSFANTLHHLYGTTVYQYKKKKGELQINYLVEGQISIQLNPKSEFWKREN